MAELYDRHAGTVFALARQIVPGPADAEEIVQDVFGQLWREAGRYDHERASVAGWVVLVARARAIDRLRARRARPDLERAAEVPAPAHSPAARTPEQVTVSAESVRHIHDALRQLPEVHRHLVELAYFRGLTLSEIGARTGVPAGTAKTRLRTALAALRGALK